MCMTPQEKAEAAAFAFAVRYCPYELADCGGTYYELIDETVSMLLTEPQTVLDYYGEE